MITRHISFRHAINGLILALKTEANHKIHLSLSFLAIGGGLLLHISYYEFLIIIMLISIGIALETINTAIEHTNDAIDLKKRPDIKMAKDLGAGSMLAFSIGAFIIAGIIFIPKIITYLHFTFNFLY